MHCRIAGPLTCDPGRAAAVGAWPAGHAPLPACEANAMDRLPAPKHRRVESEATGPAPHPPCKDEPMGEEADGRLPSGGRPPAPHPGPAPSGEPVPRPWEDEPMEVGTDDRLPSGGRTSAPPPMPAPNNVARRVELLDPQQQDQEDYAAAKDSLVPPAPRTQID